MPSMHLLFGLAILGFSLLLFNLDDVKTELALNDVADLSGLQRERGLLELRHHLSVTKPTQVATFLFASWIARKLFCERGEIFSGTCTLEDLFSLRARLFVIQFRMLGDVRADFRVTRLGRRNQSLLSIGRRQQSRLLKHDLQLNIALLIETRGNTLALAEKDCRQLSSNFLHLLIWNLLTSHHWIAGLRIGDELLKSFLLTGLFEEGINVSIGRRCGRWL